MDKLWNYSFHELMELGMTEVWNLTMNSLSVFFTTTDTLIPIPHFTLQQASFGDFAVLVAFFMMSLFFANGVMVVKQLNIQPSRIFEYEEEEEVKKDKKEREEILFNAYNKEKEREKTTEELISSIRNRQKKHK